MFTLEDMKKLLVQKIKNQYYYPIEVHSSVDEENTICINIYCVEKSIENEIEDYIYELQENLDPGYDFLFLPMIKSVDITKKYYPAMFKRFCFNQQQVGVFKGSLVNLLSMFEGRMPYRLASVETPDDLVRGCRNNDNGVFQLSIDHLSNWHSQQNNSVDPIQTDILKCA
ncbi:hypothetical protein KKF34_03485 [Myxococcota bacterium]|nr:hypothetical protein [Myxococcota bacterium]MBU1382146.1 hypothetical protein [Myxococcota bacterium]MBU1495919.1 hypothetical protein [Myxococcota bacterium]